MVRKTTCLLSGALALLVSLPVQNVSAQLALRTPDSKMEESVVKEKPSKDNARQTDFVRKHPMLAKVKSFGTSNNTFNNGLSNIKAVGTRLKSSLTAGAPLQEAAAGRELWGCVASQSTWASGSTAYGVYSFKAASPITVSPVALNDNMVATGGGALVDGVYHMVYSVESWGMIFMTHYAFDTNTWQQTAAEDMEDYALFAKETAVASDGSVYGEFYTSSLDGFELGVIDYNTLTRTTIGSLTNSYVALGITSDNVLYGVASDGNLYKIDATTAQETLIGATGLTVGNSWGDYYGQSGEIDYRTNTFYWAAVDTDHNCGLYTVNLTTGAATKVADFPAEEQIYALSIPEPPTAEAAPAAVTNVTLAFDGASLTGTVSFTAPLKTYGGAELTGELDYYIVVGGDTIGSGKTTAGAKVEQTVTVKNGGSLRFKVTTANTAGSSPKAISAKYVGYDTPNNIETVKLTANESTGEVALTWSAPTTGVNGGYVGGLTYDVVRYPDSVTVATGLTDTTFTETLTAQDMKAYHYGVVAVNGTKKSAETASNNVVIGPAIVPPYTNNFDGTDALDLMTIIDANNDGCTWSLFTYYDNTGHARYKYNNKNSGDDWLLTPSLKLEAGKEYIVSFEAASYQKKYPERLEVKYGVGSDPTTYTGVVLDTTLLTSSSYVIYTQAIVPETSGDMKIGFHCISDPMMYYLLLENLKVSEGSAVTAPDSATSVKVAPDANGALESTVSFTLPAKAINGNSLSAITKVDVLRNGEVIGSMTSGLTPGATVSYTDTTVPQGKNTYSVRIYNANGGGRYSNEASAYVGLDKPEDIASDGIKMVDNTSSISLSWAPVTTGVNGGYVNPNELLYSIYGLGKDDYGYSTFQLLDSVKGTTAYDIQINTAEGDQKLVNYALTAKNAMGESSKVYTGSMVSGKPYTMPFRETFAGGKRTHEMWWTTMPGASGWNMTSRLSADEMGGSAMFYGYDDEAYLASGKIDIKGAASPKLVFKTCADVKSDATIKVLVRRFNGTVDSIATVTYNTADSTATTQWATTSVSLAKYVNDPYVVLQFCGNGSTDGYIYVDDINVREVYENNLAAEISAPASVKKGDNATVSVKVSNYGDNASSAYTVKLYAGQTLVETKEVTEPLASFDNQTITFDYKPSVLDEATSVELTATVELVGDADVADNTAKATVELLAPTKGAPQSATATAKGNTAEVTWTAPSTAKVEVTDGFEDYTSWSTDNFGDWTCVDGDKGLAGKLLADGYSYSHQGETFAFEIWEPETIFEGFTAANPSFAPHSGNKYAAAVYSTLNGSYTDANNWLISPLLSGDKQTVKFYAMNQGDQNYIFNETIEVLYSMSDSTDTASFVPVDTITLDQMEWTEVSFEVPAGATHFAIRHITEDGGFMLAIDDVTYVGGDGSLVGYNIYRNGEYVVTVSADVASYVDTMAPSGESCTYAVTAVYADGESAPVTATPIIVTDIDNINANNGNALTVYTVDGKLVGTGIKSLSGLKKGVYIVNDKKTVVK